MPCAAFQAGKHIVMVNVEADVLVGPWLARQAAAAGVVYSMAYGDQPALTCELVDWAACAALTWWPLAKAQNTCRRITPQPQPRSGTITA